MAAAAGDRPRPVADLVVPAPVAAAANDGWLPARDPERVRRGPSRTLLLAGGAVLAVILAVGVNQLALRSEKAAAPAASAAADAAPAKIAPAATLADNDQKKLNQDRIETPAGDGSGETSAEAGKVGVTAASAGDDNGGLPRALAPAGPAQDRPAKAGDAPAAAGQQVVDAVATGKEDGSVAASKVLVPDAGGNKPAIGGNAAADNGAVGKSPGAPAPVGKPAADIRVTDAAPRVPSGETQMDDILNGKGVPIPVNADPLGIAGGRDATALPGGAAGPRGAHP
jgi:hypothetical protein